MAVGYDFMATNFYNFSKKIKPKIFKYLIF